MYKIGLIGAENSHAEHFAVAFNLQKLYDDSRVTHIFGDDQPEKACALSKEFSLINCMGLDELFDACDAVVIAYRKGSLHHAAAMRALAAGKPAFIDKPFTTDYRHAVEICEYAKEHDLLICGGTNLKGLHEINQIKAAIKPGSTVVISLSADAASEYDGYHFYGSHSAELCIELLGTDYRSCTAVKNNDTVIVTITYDDAQCVFINAPNTDGLNITLYNKGEITRFDIPLDYQSVGSTELINMLNTKTPPRDYSHYTAAVMMVLEIMEQI